MKLSRLLAIGVCVAAPASAMALTPLWMRDVKISPDGRTIAFQYKGDIWTVPVEGGNAERLTTMDSYEANPVWSPDSRYIAFQSVLHGNFDIFVVPATGGKALRLLGALAHPAGGPERRYARVTELHARAHILQKLHILGIGGRIARFDEVHAQVVQPPEHLELVLARKNHAFGLRSVTQRGIKYLYMAHSLTLQGATRKFSLPI